MLSCYNSKRRKRRDPLFTETELRLLKQLGIAVSILLFLTLLSGCSTTSFVKPSPLLTQDCDYPVLEGKTYRDVVKLADKRGESLKECTARMKALRGEK